MPEESIKHPDTQDSLATRTIFSGTKIELKLDETCFRQKKETFDHKNRLNLSIV